MIVHKVKRKVVHHIRHGFVVAPLKGSFMVASIIGFIISAVGIYNRWPAWGFAFALLFMLMFIASLISMTYAPLEETHKM